MDTLENLKLIQTVMFLLDASLQIFCGNWSVAWSSVCAYVCIVVWLSPFWKLSYKMGYRYLTGPLWSFALSKCQSLNPSWSTGGKVGFHPWWLIEINIKKCPDILLTCLIILLNTQLIALQKKTGNSSMSNRILFSKMNYPHGWLRVHWS